ncbi:interferon-induced, double-stranded RNA-activated protein kinase-like [Folsomia candida]|uniref:interferon-induced, double-stranded RNA-activated protein kinase-like n=1 Tax=Folsomia candida TaxID=158441 RepID=UPI001604E2F1|nr:interferon-induced, double-stranded RNA-activated protein kinase-like [Folsomia candida]
MKSILYFPVELTALQTSLEPHPVLWRTIPSLQSLGKLGSGYFGTVLKAIDTVDVYNLSGCAIKCVDIDKTLNSMPLNDSAVLFSKLLNEVRVLSKLNSDHVVKYDSCWAACTSRNGITTHIQRLQLEAYIDTVVEEASVSVGIPTSAYGRNYLFLKLEFCDTTLDKYIAKFKNTTGCHTPLVTNIWETALQIAIGLRYIHTKKIIHRDLKPANILGVLVNSNTIVWKIADFGLSVTSEEEEYYGNPAGTAIYRSPEMRNGSVYSSQTDVYSLGLCFLELVQLCGNTFDKVDVFEKLITLREQSRRNLIKNIIPKCVHKFGKIIIEMLQEDPINRCNSGRLFDYINRHCAKFGYK